MEHDLFGQLACTTLCYRCQFHFANYYTLWNKCLVRRHQQTITDGAMEMARAAAWDKWTIQPRPWRKEMLAILDSSQNKPCSILFHGGKNWRNHASPGPALLCSTLLYSAHLFHGGRHCPRFCAHARGQDLVRQTCKVPGSPRDQEPALSFVRTPTRCNLV